MGEIPGVNPDELEDKKTDGDEEKEEKKNIKYVTDTQGNVHPYDGDEPGARQKLIEELREADRNG